MTPGERYAKSTQEHFESTVKKRVQLLRDLADEIERESARDVADVIANKHEWSSFTRVAGQVVHAVTWEVANLNLSGLIEAGHDADNALRESQEDGR